MKLCAIALSVLSCLFSHAQRFDSILLKLNREYKQEKLYIHFDRNVYSPGETIWFKAYVFSGNYPSLISRTVYAELLDNKGKVLDRKTIPVLLSSAAGSFDLPPDQSSVVFIRAYTKWMLNFDSAFLYTRAISILPIKQPVNKTILHGTKTNTAKASSTQKIFLQFFPEGGDLVQDVESRVAFKATNNFGFPVTVSGDILDSKGNRIASFSTGHDGMGKLILVPKKDEQYRVLWKDHTGVTYETVLPSSRPNGIVLEVNNTGNKIEFKLTRSAYQEPPYPFVYVVAQINQHILYRAKVNISKTSTATGYIPIKDLPTGITQLTVFTPAEKPIAERIIFINKKDRSFIADLKTNLTVPDKRKKSTIDIDIPDTIGTNLSIAITDADLYGNETRDNIFSHLLLTSDIKGYIHDPAYYFSSDADTVADHLDLVMMTNGWRRFNWDKVLEAQFPALKYMPEDYLSIEGKIAGINTKELAGKELNGILELKNKNNLFLNTTIEPEGKFIFRNTIFYDTARLFYQINKDKKRLQTPKGTFEVKNNLLNHPLNFLLDSALLFNTAVPDTMAVIKNLDLYNEKLSDLELQKVKTLKEVVVTTQKKTNKEIADEEYTSGLFTTSEAHKNYTFLPEDDPALLSAQSILNYLKERIPGLQISFNEGAAASLFWRGENPCFFLDELPSTLLTIESVSMSEVAMIKVFTPPFIGCWQGGAGGAIAVYLKKTGKRTDLKGLDHIIITGYSPVKEFYSPDHSTERIPFDYRKTLYWNPYLITDKANRHISVSFYNNDITKKIKIIIEGSNEDGKLIRIEKILQ